MEDKGIGELSFNGHGVLVLQDEDRDGWSAGSHRPQQRAMGSFRAESDLLVMDPYRWAKSVRSC